ncbi:N-acetyl sugar amidotransferase [Cylindrospermopsis raciborskii UAM/DH-MRr]|jgi:N-acetyl sugar amidotransferase|uniref:N-acetyl sugar amidotransferase n=1 Tax=Cylindrospermopsis raciborskii TaxID=77022 RepID=UPI00387A695D
MKFREYKTCAKTVINSTYPGVKFDKYGISNVYWDFQNNTLPKWQYGNEGRHRLARTIDLLKKQGKGKDFDCILGLSGGLDSSYMLHTVVTEFGLRPLVFHVDGGWNTELAVHNINCLVDKLGLDLFTEVINWEEMRNFQLAMFKSGVPHIDIPQDMAFIGVLYKFADKYNIKFIMNGGNISTEGVQIPLEIIYWGTDMRQIQHILRNYGTIPMKTYPFSSIFYHKVWLLLFKGVEVLKPLNMLPYRRQTAIDTLSKEYGWKAYTQKHFESRFTRFFEGYWLPSRFNFDMRQIQYSSLILTNQMSREEALAKLEEPPYDLETANQDFLYVATKLGITEEELRSYHQMPKRSYRDYPNLNLVLHLGERILSFFKGTRRGGAY